MTRDEFRKFAMALKTYYPREQLLPNREAMELWYRELADIPYTVAEAALRKYVSTNKFSPTIADIREMAATVMYGEKPQWADGWNQLEKAIRKYGSYNVHAAMESMDDITRATVKRLGYRNLCLSTNQMADRANFRTVFEQLVDRRQKEQQMSISLSQIIESIQERGVDAIENQRSERISAPNSKA